MKNIIIAISSIFSCWRHCANFYFYSNDLICHHNFLIIFFTTATPLIPSLLNILPIIISMLREEKIWWQRNFMTFNNNFPLVISTSTAWSKSFCCYRLIDTFLRIFLSLCYCRQYINGNNNKQAEYFLITPQISHSPYAESKADNRWTKIA